MTTGTELITMQQAEEAILHGATLDTVDEDAIQTDMVQRILASEELADAFANFTATPAKDIEGIAVEVSGIAFMKSAYEAGPAVYALLRVVRPDTGEQLTVSMGGKTLMASFIWAMRHEAMPIKGSFVRLRSNSNTERAYWTFKLA